MITKDWSITDIVEKYPETADVLLSFGMHCFGCMAARFENIEQGAMAHGIDIDELMTAVNAAVKK